MADFPDTTTTPKIKLLDIIDELNRGRHFVSGAYMAVHGASGLDSDEMNALAQLLGAARDRFEAVEEMLRAAEL